MKFYLATKNAHKCGEMNRILKPLGIETVCEAELSAPLPQIEENGDTFEENAKTKAVLSCAYTGLPAIADDSGLCVDALKGAPGVYSARFAGEPADDAANNRLLLKKLEGLPKQARSARFVSVIACAFPDGTCLLARGECEGYIGFAPEGTNGFGYDPLFWTDAGCFGVLSDAQKDSVSHRGNALRKFSEILQTFLQEKAYNHDN